MSGNVYEIRIFRATKNQIADRLIQRGNPHCGIAILKATDSEIQRVMKYAEEHFNFGKVNVNDDVMELVNQAVRETGLIKATEERP